MAPDAVLADQDDSGRGRTDGPPLSTPTELRELVRQTRVRLGEAERLRAELHVITAQADRRLRESRLLLERAHVRRVGAAPSATPRV